jgi:hypothetical protein
MLLNDFEYLSLRIIRKHFLMKIYNLSSESFDASPSFLQKICEV